MIPSRVALPLALALLGACLGERPKTGAAAARRVAVDPDVVNFSRRGDQLILAGRVYRGNLLAADTGKFTWRAVDSAVASVTPDGVVTASGDGVTRIWGVSGTDSAFAVVVVQAPALPPVVTVSPNRLLFSALSAVTRLVVSSNDTMLRDSLPVCRSDDPKIATVDSVIIRTQGNGTTRIHCSIAGVEGIATVSVRQRIVRVKVVSDQEQLALRVGRDSLNLVLARVDSLRQPVARGVPRFVSLDTGVVRVDPVRGTVVALKLGSGRVVGSIEGLVDTAVIRVVEVAPPPTVSSVNARRGGAAGSATRRPGVRVAGRATVARSGPTATQVGARDYQARDSIFQVRTLSSASFARWAPMAFASLVERRLDDGSNAAGDPGRSTGVMGGVELEVTPVRWLRVHLLGASGSIKKKTTAGETGTISEGELDVGLALFPGLWIRAGAARRGVNTQGLLGQWSSVRTGVEGRFGLGKGSMQGMVRFTYLPYVTAPTPPRPSLGLSGEAGVDYRRGAITAGLHYRLERLDYPTTSTGRRRERFGTLRLGLGLELGR